MIVQLAGGMDEAAGTAAATVGAGCALMLVLLRTTLGDWVKHFTMYHFASGWCKARGGCLKYTNRRAGLTPLAAPAMILVEYWEMHLGHNHGSLTVDPLKQARV